MTHELNIKYDVSSLNKIRKFYNLVGKVATVSPMLTYSHYVELLSIKNINKIKYYIMISEQQNLSVRELRQRIKNNEYERLSKESKNKLITNQEAKVDDLIKNPIIIKNHKNYKIIT